MIFKVYELDEALLTVRLFASAMVDGSTFG
jgi:hypothetical protein